MSVYYFHVAMKRVTVKSPAVVRDILQQYDTRPLLDVVGSELETGRLVLDAEEYLPDNYWPSAVRADDLPAEVDDEDDDDAHFDWLDEARELHEAKGEEGLNELLLKLAPYLTAPLILQAAFFASDGDFGEAKEWTVHPGATSVKCREIVGFDNDAESITDLAATTVFANGVH
jgi:hypothetical protein